ncbi:protein translocase subunit SecD [Prochlorococcus marinus]|uniref:protein translocase subunit SecD n=1 Tax=Prochlorococcus marinus TaxID=1219 RepID=UPI0022B49EEA|nr:protein translocase subunit SecD [Prochlorococcus marinus]
MGRKNYWFLVVILFAVLSIFICTNIPFQLGLDLRGGSQLTLEVQTTDDIPKITPDDIEGVKAVLDRRVNGLGVSDSQLQTIGTNQLLLELPGEQDPSGAAKVLGETALLEFRIQRNGTEVQLRDLQTQRNSVESIIKLLEDNNSAQLRKEININNEINKLFEKYNIQSDQILDIDQFNLLKNKINTDIAGLFEPTLLTGQYLTNAGRRQDQITNNWEVTLSFNNEGGELFADLSKSIAGTSRLLGIVIDGISYSEASVGKQFETAGITGGAATISGNFTADDARNLEVQLRGGALPLPIDIVQIRTIGPSLGTQNIRLSLFAALTGLLFVGVFMIFIYKLAGFVAVLALSFYSLFTLSIYALLPVTLTLPGIAGFILSIGMAVDANVLIFERLKEELRNGNTLIRSIDASFKNAFSSIIDGHLTTLISCITLFYLGTGFVKGFAATLGIGVVLSLFTALTCTKAILKFLMSYQGLRKTSNFINPNQIPSPSINLQ